MNINQYGGATHTVYHNQWNYTARVYIHEWLIYVM